MYLCLPSILRFVRQNCLQPKQHLQPKQQPLLTRAIGLKAACLLVCVSVILSAVNVSIAAADPVPEPQRSIAPASSRIIGTNAISTEISTEKVSQFVQAYLKVLALIEQREGELQGAETESEFQRVQQEIEAEAFAAIEAAGLTEPEYLQLLGLANSDPEFGERIASQLQEAAP
jgi:hypothetical protein